jgi:diguanylate cyclase (GGDEF)-like protein/PAS domain S-box-containing protein
MEDKKITKEQLTNKLVNLSQRIAELEKSVVEYQQIEESLRESEEKFRILVEMATDGIFIETVKGRILECNTAGAKMYGYTKEEIIGLTLADLVPKEFAKTLPQVFSDKETTHGIFLPRISKKKDGTIFPTEIASKIINIAEKPRLIAYIRDITKRKEAEKKLKKVRKMFASLFASSPEAALYHDENGRIISINPRFTEIFGYILKEIRGRDINEGMRYPEGKIEEGERLSKKALKGVTNYETVRKKKDGTLIPVIISASPVMIDEKPQGIIVLYKDITERKQSEQLNTVLYNISKAANSDISLNQLYPLIHQELNNIINATNFFIALVDIEKDEMSFPYHKDEKDNDFPTRRLSRANNLTAYIIRSVQSLLVNQKQIEKMADEGDIKLKSVGIVTAGTHWLGVPLKIKNKIIGAMVVQGYINPHLFSKKDIQLMEFVSSQIATAIQRKQMEEEMEKLAHFDSLTGACNRGYGLGLLSRELKFARRRKTPFLLVYIDIDDFKNINDTFGHGEGDQVLKKVVKLLKSTLRDIDIICRMGGDEFLLIFPESSPKDLPIINERFNRNLIKFNQTIKKAYKIGFSIGISYYDPKNPQHMDELIRIADNRMYEEKKKKLKRKK